jgi:hypothetical protein
MRLAIARSSRSWFGRGLFDGADAEVDNRLAHGSASRFEMSKVIFEKAGFVAVTKLVFVRVLWP